MPAPTITTRNGFCEGLFSNAMASLFFEVVLENLRCCKNFSVLVLVFQKFSQARGRGSLVSSARVVGLPIGGGLETENGDLWRKVWLMCEQMAKIM